MSFSIIFKDKIHAFDTHCIKIIYNNNNKIIIKKVQKNMEGYEKEKE